MGLIVLFAVGGVVGWLASILAGGDDTRSFALNVFAGIGGALLVGMLTSTVPLMDGLSATTLFAGTIGAIAMVAGFAFLRLRMVR